MSDLASTGLRIVSWNIAKSREAWTNLILPEPYADVALLQEAQAPSDEITVQTIPPREASWSTAGGDRNFCAAVVRLSERIRMSPIPATSLTYAQDREFAVSRPGSLAAAEIAVDDEEPIVVVSMYATWEVPQQGHWHYADASAHRLISDLSYFIGSQRGHRVIAAGDLNILFGHGENGSQYWCERYASVFSRMKALGLPFVGPQYPGGLFADPWPQELPAESQNVPTFRRQRNVAQSATRQLDFVFASESLRDQITVRALNAADTWGPSDHCRVLIDVALRG